MGISSSSLRPYTYIKQSLYKQKDNQVVLGVECPNTYFKIPCILEMVLKVARFRMAVARPCDRFCESFYEASQQWVHYPNNQFQSLAGQGT